MKLSPLEVDRELYKYPEFIDKYFFKFPAPIEVDRELYIKGFYGQNKSDRDAFPAPLEVDRYLYFDRATNTYFPQVIFSFRPLSR